MDAEATGISLLGSAMVEVEGIMFPKYFEVCTGRPMKDHINDIRALEIREDDVLLCAIAKAGTHWLWEVGTMLLAGKAEYGKSTKDSMMLEETPIPTLQALPSPRLLNTHLPVSMLPRQVTVGKKVKVIHVYRNPKDVMVSNFFHARQTPEFSSVTLDMMVQYFLSEKFAMGNYFNYFKEMDMFLKDNPDLPVFNISFEDMKEDLKGTVQSLAQFLQVAASEELCQAITEACSFSNMKDADQTKQNPDRDRNRFVQIYRKGVVGDWKNHLTVAASEQIDTAMETLRHCDFRFRYTL